MTDPAEHAQLRATIDDAQRYRPLVLSICRRILRRGEDVEDAAQETFARLLRHADAVHGSMSSWLSTTARSVCLEMIRRDVRERRRREGLRRGTSDVVEAEAATLRRTALEHALPAAFEILEEANRSLIIRRFLQRAPLRQIAGESGQSIATVSRRAQASLARLGEVLAGLGVASLSDDALADHFADGVLLGGATLERDEPLRFAPDWRALAASYENKSKVLLPGQRPIRVGFVITYTSAMTLGNHQLYHELEQQVWTASLLNDPMFKLVGILEPGTIERAPVERTLREYELTAGLISGDDVAGLKTLDVIVLGIHFVIQPAVIRAIHEAVTSGVGLINEYWTGLDDQTPETRDLYLSAVPVHKHHEPPVCGTPVTARVIREHPLLPGLKEGDEFRVGGCGPAVMPMEGVETFIVKGRPIEPSVHKIPGVGTMRLPVFATGQLGKGRVLWCGVWQHEGISKHLSVRPEVYMRGLLQWVARVDDSIP